MFPQLDTRQITPECAKLCSLFHETAVFLSYESQESKKMKITRELINIKFELSTFNQKLTLTYQSQKTCPVFVKISDVYRGPGQTRIEKIYINYIRLQKVKYVESTPVSTQFVFERFWNNSEKNILSKVYQFCILISTWKLTCFL